MGLLCIMIWYKKEANNMSEHEFDFENEISIDLDDLHEEWRKHPGIRKKYADEVTYLEKVKQKTHERVKVVRSQLIQEAKELKLTSADLREAYYREHENHVKAKEEQIEAEYELGMSWNALTAFDDRKYGLQNEVKLWTRNYFATPREERIVDKGKGIVDSIKDEKAQKHRERINQTHKRIRREEK